MQRAPVAQPESEHISDSPGDRSCTLRNDASKCLDPLDSPRCVPVSQLSSVQPMNYEDTARLLESPVADADLGRTLQHLPSGENSLNDGEHLQLNVVESRLLPRLDKHPHLRQSAEDVNNAHDINPFIPNTQPVSNSNKNSQSKKTCPLSSGPPRTALTDREDLVTTPCYELIETAQCLPSPVLLDSNGEPFDQGLGTHPKSLHSHSISLDQRKLTLCGLGNARPLFLQRFASKKWMLFWLCWFCLVQGMIVNGLVPSILSTIERRFDFPESALGRIVSMYDIGYVICCVPVSYFGGRHSKPLFLGIGILFLGFGSFMFSMPHMFSEAYEYRQPDQVDGTAGAEYGTCSPDVFGTNWTLGAKCEEVSNPYTSYLASWINFDISRKLQFEVLFCFAHMMHGIGATPLFTLGVSYIDENVKPSLSSLYLGIFYAFAIFGPAVGFGASSTLLRYHTDWFSEATDGSGADIGESDPRWIGAWWPAFLMSSAVCLLGVFPILAFPKVLPETYHQKKLSAMDFYRTRVRNSGSNDRFLEAVESNYSVASTKITSATLAADIGGGAASDGGRPPRQDSKADDKHRGSSGGKMVDDGSVNVISSPKPVDSVVVATCVGREGGLGGGRQVTTSTYVAAPAASLSFHSAAAFCDHRDPPCPGTGCIYWKNGGEGGDRLTGVAQGLPHDLQQSTSPRLLPNVNDGHLNGNSHGMVNRGASSNPARESPHRQLRSSAPSPNCAGHFLRNFCHDIHHIPRSVKRLFTNQCYMFLNCAAAVDSIIITGFSTFMSKYLEYQFSLRTSKANLYIGLLMVPAAGIGTLVSGYIVTRFRLDVAKTLKLCVSVCLFSLVLSPMFLVYCGNVPLLGVQLPYPNTPKFAMSNNRSSPGKPVLMGAACHAHCTCSDSGYYPMCGRTDGVPHTFYSPCIAGCPGNYNPTSKVYHNCTCVDEGLLERGFCESKCANLVVFLLLFAPMCMLTFSLGVPSLSVILRCVDYHERSFALGIQWILIRCFGTIPAPALFGWLFNLACLKRHYDECTGEYGKCFAYDSQMLSNLFLFLGIICQTFTLLFFVLALIFYKGQDREVIGKDAPED